LVVEAASGQLGFKTSPSYRLDLKSGQIGFEHVDSFMPSSDMLVTRCSLHTKPNSFSNVASNDARECIVHGRKAASHGILRFKRERIYLSKPGSLVQ
jgi:hypothetical protein